MEEIEELTKEEEEILDKIWAEQTITLDDVLKRSAMDSFVESEHPRDKDGKFSTKEESKEPEKEHVERMTRTLEKRLYGNKNCQSFSDEERAAVKSKISENISKRLSKSKAFNKYVDYIGEDSKEVVSSLIQSWANTSADHDEKALFIQKTAQRIFHLDEAETSHFPDIYKTINGKKVATLDRGIQLTYLEEQLEMIDNNIDFLEMKITAPTKPDDYDETTKELAKNRQRKTALNAQYEKIVTTDIDEEIVTEAIEDFLKAQYEETQALFKEQGITHIRVHRGMLVEEYSTILRHMNEAVALQPLSSFSTNKEIAENFADSDIPYGEKRQLSIVLSSNIPVENVLSTCQSGFGCLTEGEIVLLGRKIDAEWKTERVEKTLRHENY